MGGWRKKQAGCQALKIVLKNDKLKLKKSRGGEFKETHWKLTAPREPRFLLPCRPFQSGLDAEVGTHVS